MEWIIERSESLLVMIDTFLCGNYSHLFDAIVLISVQLPNSPSRTSFVI